MKTKQPFIHQGLVHRVILISLFALLLLIVSGCGGLGGTECGNPNNSAETCNDTTGDDGTTGTDDGTTDDFTCTFCFVEGTQTSPESCEDCEPADTGDDTTSTCTVDSCSFSETGTVLFGLCDVVAACDDTITSLTCIEGIYDDRTTLDAFGVSAAYLSFEPVQTAVDEGSIVVSEAALENCTDALTAVSCAEISAAGYQIGAGDFSTLSVIVPTTCQNVF